MRKPSVEPRDSSDMSTALSGSVSEPKARNMAIVVTTTSRNISIGSRLSIESIESCWSTGMPPTRKPTPLLGSAPSILMPRSAVTASPTASVSLGFCMLPFDMRTDTCWPRTSSLSEVPLTVSTAAVAALNRAEFGSAGFEWVKPGILFASSSTCLIWASLALVKTIFTGCPVLSGKSSWNLSCAWRVSLVGGR
ncbi:hypothetical protein FK268_19485 [Tsukamurella sputi]|uniref:Uncharacterized protein n=1 Tax=Tsukamurella sputi TaxID=2591848 RepID=A0A5C5RI31_9ACTN|nr:hypothetical protein FK268_19485 [Tsukamurella sputi]